MSGVQPYFSRNETFACHRFSLSCIYDRWLLPPCGGSCSVPSCAQISGTQSRSGRFLPRIAPLQLTVTTRLPRNLRRLRPDSPPLLICQSNPRTDFRIPHKLPSSLESTLGLSC